MINLLDHRSTKAALIITLEKGLVMTIVRLVVNIQLDEVEPRYLGITNTLESQLMVLTLPLLLAQLSIAGIVAELEVQSTRDLMVEVEVVSTSRRDGGGIEEAGLFIIDGTGEGLAVGLGVSVLLVESVGSN